MGNCRFPRDNDTKSQHTWGIIVLGQISDLSLILPGEGKPSRGCVVELGEPVQEPFYTHQVKKSVGGVV